MKNYVAIVGRPNVGKSTLFNRLIEEKKAIIEDHPGVTRDRNYGEAFWSGHNFTIIDTGGFSSSRDDSFVNDINSQINFAIDEADLILFLVDCKEGLTGYDSEFAEILRKSQKPVIVVANKADNQSGSFISNEFYSLGFEMVFPISSISGYGTGELLDSVVKYFPKEENQEDSEESVPKISIIGRPNVGKSSMLNLLLGNERSIVASVAGTTRDSVDTHYNLFGKNFILTDTAGLRKKNKVTDDIEYYSGVRAMKSIQSSDVCILMVDAELGFESQDMNLLVQAYLQKKGILIVVNKWDLIDKDHLTMNEYVKRLKEKLGSFSHIPIIFTSVPDKVRVFKVVEKALEISSIREKRVPTSKLNEYILPEIERLPPPAVRGMHIKIKYCTQLPTPYPSFVFFCNHPQYVRKTYLQFLENKVRSIFGFWGSPVKIFMRKK